MDSQAQDGTGSGSLGKDTPQAGVALRKLQSSRSPTRKVFFLDSGKQRPHKLASGEYEAPWGGPDGHLMELGPGGSRDWGRGGRSPNFFGKTVFAI